MNFFLFFFFKVQEIVEIEKYEGKKEKCNEKNKKKD